MRTKRKLILISTVFGLMLLGGSFWPACGQQSSDSYWPLTGNAEWITQGWTVINDHGLSTWQQNGRLRAAGSFEEAHGDWRVIEVSAYFQQQWGIFGMAFLRFNDDHIEVLGLSPESFSGSAAEILMPSTGPLSFDLSLDAIDQTQSADFDVVLGESAVHIQLEVTVESRGLPFETVAGHFDDVLILNLVIHSSEQGSDEVENQSVRIWLAWGYGPIHAEKTKGDTRTNGDFLRN